MVVARSFPQHGGGMMVNPKLPYPRPFHSDVQLELVFILDFHVLFHVIDRKLMISTQTFDSRDSTLKMKACRQLYT